MTQVLERQAAAAAMPQAQMCEAPDGGEICEKVATLLERFAAAGVVYCYWRSLARLGRALRGQSDLDLLVARESRQLTETILLGSGFKRFPAIASRQIPGVESYLGHDERGGRLVHVHLHHRLVLGEALLKQFHPPWEKALLARRERHAGAGVPVFDAESEAVLLAARMACEMSWADPVGGWRHAKQRAKFEADRAGLAERVDATRLRLRAEELLGAGSGDLAVAFITRPEWSAGHDALLRHARRALAPYRSGSMVEIAATRLWRVAAAAFGRLNRRVLLQPRPWARRCPGGGLVVAVMGVDGSGKSTLVRALHEWLGSEVDVLPVYFGTGDGRPSLLLRPFKALVPLATRLLRRKPRGSSHGAVSATAPGFAYSVLLTVWASVLAVEKRAKLRAARRAADRGMVVLGDRFPQDEIASYNDGPLLPRLVGVPGFLRRFEAASYAAARVLPPDLVIKLAAPVETLAEREPSMDRAVMRERVASLQALSFPRSRVVVLAADNPLETVIADARRAVWKLI